MNFCMITTFYPPYSFGGDGTFVRDLAVELAVRGHEVDVIHCRDAYRALGGVAVTRPEEATPNVTVHGLESRLGALSPLATHQTGRPILKRRRIEEVLRKRFDVIHYHNVSLVGGPAVLQQGRALKLYTLHEYWLVCPTNLLLRDGRTPCVTPRCAPCTLRQRRPPQLWRRTRLLDRSLRCIDAFLSPSRFAAAQHARLGLTAPVVHLPTFVPTAEPVARATPAEPYFLYAGRLEHAKGTHTLLEPFRAWGKAKLIVAGAGSEERRLREAATGTDRIELTGQVPRDGLRTLYRNAVAVIVPSLTYELFPLVILEAFREGTPVIARDHGSLPEPVHDSGGGLLYRDDRELIARAERLLRDPALRDELGARGLAAVRGRWSADAHIARYL
ncbi:MAG: glycosyltransferase, partial [Thermodesulfobacteriota bacterium]